MWCHGIVESIVLGYTRQNSRLFVWCYGIVESIVLVVLLWTTTDQFQGEEDWIFGLAVFASVGALAKWCFVSGLLRMAKYDIMDMAQEKTDLKLLYSGEQWTELSDVITFKIPDIRTACNAIFVEFTFHSLSLLNVHFISVFDTVLGSKWRSFFVVRCGIWAC